MRSSREDIVAGLTVFALLAAFVAVFVVASTFALSVQQRHRELALFRAIGSTPRQVRQDGRRRGAARLARRGRRRRSARRRRRTARARTVRERRHAARGPRPRRRLASVRGRPRRRRSSRRSSPPSPAPAARPGSARRMRCARPRYSARPISWRQGTGRPGRSRRRAGRSDSPPAEVARAAHRPPPWSGCSRSALLGPLLAWPFAWLIGLAPDRRSAAGRACSRGANARANLRRVASVATPVMLALSLVSTMYFAKTILQQQTTEETARRTVADHVLRARDTPRACPRTRPRRRAVCPESRRRPAPSPRPSSSPRTGSISGRSRPAPSTRARSPA